MKHLITSFLLFLFVILLLTDPSLASEADAIVADEASGLPQFDISKYSQQIFWLIINFGILYFFVKYYVIKKIKKIKANRSGVILANIEKSMKIKKNIDKINAEISSIKNNHRIEIAKSRDILLKKISDLSKNKQEEMDKHKSLKLAEFEQQKKEYAQTINFESDAKELSDSIIEKLNLNK